MFSNLMLESSVGLVGDAKGIIYLKGFNMSGVEW